MSEPIARNIAATRDAFGLTHIVQHTFEGSNSVDSGSLQADALSLANIRLWDPDPQIALQTFQKLQDLRSYYTFQSLGVDRYTLNGGMTPTLAGVRQLNAADLPAASWVNTIPIGDVSASGGVHNVSAVTATLTNSTAGGEGRARWT